MSSGGGDPHRVLGVPHDASEAEIRRAYRALAKRNHPDAGQGSVARFLEIQAAYEALVSGDHPGAPSRRGAPSGQGARPSSEWARRARPAAPRRRDPDPTSGGSPNAGPRPSAGTRPSAESGPGRPGQPGDGAGRPRTGDPGRGRRAHERRRATLGSTSYDEAGALFEPDWGGASWYGPSSGTYWTLNPREYADPRKHGPEYQARARRPAAAEPPDGASNPGTAAPAQPSADAASMPRPPKEPVAAEHTAPAGPGVVARILEKWRRGRIRE